MPDINYTNVDSNLDDGFNIMFVTMNHNTPPHWHRAIEILYILNGNATVQIDNSKYKVNPLDMIVIDSSHPHDVRYALPHTMGICIYISKTFMRKYVPNLELMQINCNTDELLSQQQEPYMQLCEFLKDLTLLYVNQPDTYLLDSNATILKIMSCLVTHFSTLMTDTISVTDIKNIERMEQINEYVKKHYKEPITLQDAADELMLNKDYFCRFFKKNMGVSFITYINHVRISHIYHELLHSDDNTLDIMERNGFYNQKVFYRLFKERYGCTPRELRKLKRENPFL